MAGIQGNALCVFDLCGPSARYRTFLTQTIMESTTIGLNPPESDTGDRRDEGIVPASRASLTGEGLPEVSVASTAGENAIALEVVPPQDRFEWEMEKEHQNKGKRKVKGLPKIIGNEKVVVKIERMANPKTEASVRNLRSNSRRLANRSKEGTSKAIIDISDTDLSAEMASREESTDFASTSEGEAVTISPKEDDRKRRKVVTTQGTPEIYKNKEYSRKNKERLTWDQQEGIDKETFLLEKESAVNINLRILEYLEELESLRNKSKNIKGSFQGRMRVLIESVKLACIALGERSNVKEDPIYWKNRFIDSESENLKLKERLDQLETKVITLEKRNRNLNSSSDEVLDARAREKNSKKEQAQEMRKHSGNSFASTPITTRGDYKNNDMEKIVIQTMEKFSQGFSILMNEMKSFLNKSYDALLNSIPQQKYMEELRPMKKNPRSKEDRGDSGRSILARKQKRRILEGKIEYKSDRESIHTDYLLSDSPEVLDNEIEDRKTIRNRKCLRFETNKRSSREREHTKDASLSHFDGNFPPLRNKIFDSEEKNPCTNDETRVSVSAKDDSKSEGNVGSSENERGEDSWILVNRKRSRNRKRQDYSTVLKSNYVRRPGRTSKISPVQILKRKLPQTVVISITCGPKAKYADVLLKARESVLNIEEMKIDQIKARRAITGGLLLEIIGDEAKEKAEKLVSNIREALKLFDVKVLIPKKRVELRISGFDDSVKNWEIISKLAEIGEGHPDEFRYGDIKIFRGLGSLWTRCPIEVALKIMERHKLKKINIGWCTVEIELLKNRPMQCYKCLALGHPIQRCPSVTDRMDKCINCGESGHLLRSCKNRPKCPVCQERGLNSAHRVGSDLCRIYPPKPMGKNVPQGEKTEELKTLIDKVAVDKGVRMEH